MRIRRPGENPEAVKWLEDRYPFDGGDICDVRAGNHIRPMYELLPTETHKGAAFMDYSRPWTPRDEQRWLSEGETEDWNAYIAANPMPRGTTPEPEQP